MIDGTPSGHYWPPHLALIGWYTDFTSKYAFGHIGFVDRAVVIANDTQSGTIRIGGKVTEVPFMSLTRSKLLAHSNVSRCYYPES